MHLMCANSARSSQSLSNLSCMEEVEWHLGRVYSLVPRTVNHVGGQRDSQLQEIDRCEVEGL